MKNHQEQRALEGPHSRWEELTFVFRVMMEFIRGFRTLHFVGPCVTVFGSARIPEEHEYYILTEKVGAQLVELGFTVMTGGGGGLMEAANKGAKLAGGRSVACNIVLPKEQVQNQYLDSWITLRYFFVRKVLLFKYSYAFIAMPGGVGTMDELFEAITLIQTKKIERFPVILMGAEYWKNIGELFEQMIAEGTISTEDRDLLLITDSVEEAMEHLRVHALKKFMLKRSITLEPTTWLNEK
ncbi:MAG: TIGR00730 family Rossman fold protein [Candidatus Kapabacteria bacterium]|nr:TIGR00730 family Rossman fold protein [Candidatus Kapabacteria bacterium]